MRGPGAGAGEGRLRGRGAAGAAGSGREAAAGRLEEMKRGLRLRLRLLGALAMQIIVDGCNGYSLSIYLAIYLSIYRSIYRSICGNRQRIVGSYHLISILSRIIESFVYVYRKYINIYIHMCIKVS